MSNRFWVGGTGTWDNATTTHWSTTSGGSGGASVPAVTDVAIFDGSSGGGTVTVAANVSGTALSGLTTSAFTGTIDFSVNNPSLTINDVGWTDDNTGVHTVNMGSGTWTFPTAGSPVFTAGANFTLNANTSTIAFTPTGSPTTRNFSMGGKTFATITVTAANQNGLPVSFQGGGTITTLTVGAGSLIMFANGSTYTITNAFNPTGTLSAPIIITTTSGGSVANIIASGGASLTYVGLGHISFASSTGAVNGVNSWDFGGNNYNGGSNSLPSGGGGGVGAFIGN